MRFSNMVSRSRTGFTLIELMVSMALTLVVMTILSQAFVMALNTFSGLKGLGDMQQSLRTAGTLMRADLSSNHFEGSRRLSNLDISLPGSAPNSGFFVVKHGSALTLPPAPPYSSLYRLEGTDLNGVPSYWAADHFLYFTVHRTGNRPENFFNASLQADAGLLKNFFSVNTAGVTLPPPSIPGLPLSQLSYVSFAPPYGGGQQASYSSQWAEVLYYLVLNPVEEWGNADVGGVSIPTFSLYRAQFVMVPDRTNVNKLVPNNPYRPDVLPTVNPKSTGFATMACNAGGNNFLTFFSPQDMARGLRTINPATLTQPYYDPIKNPIATKPGQWSGAWPPAQWPARLENASTLVLPNVISFDVQIMRQNVATNVGGKIVFKNDPGFDATYLTSAGTSGFLFDTTQFDTNLVTAATYSNQYSLKGIQITLRVWDSGTRQTRQNTIAQDL